MKKMMVSMMVMTCLAGAAGAQSNQTSGRAGFCPAKTCTDHSYDQAFNSQGSGMMPATAATNLNEPVSCPAKTCTNHSYDEAYSSRWSGNAQNSNSMVRVSAAPNVRTWGGMRDRHYNMNDFTVYGKYRTADMSAPYNGQDAPSYDGAANNAYRNMRTNNNTERLPANDGR